MSGKYSLGGVDECTRCPEGKFSAIWGAGECQTCSAGKYQKYEGQTSCLDCGANSVFVSATFGCNCNAGYAYNYATGPQVCNACQPGKYMNAVGRLSNCYECWPGQYVGTSGASTCFNCPAFSTSAVAAAVCTCNSGYYGPAGGPCTDTCNTGYTVSGSSCVACADGTYKATTGTGACTACPGSSSSPAGSTAASSCVCPSGTAFDAATNTVCVKLCAQGQYGTATSCEDCAVGKYKPGYEVYNTLQCTNCPTGSTTSYGGQTSVDSCKCVGQYKGKGHDAHAGMTHSIVARWECDPSVGHL